MVYVLAGFSRDFAPLAYAAIALLTVCVVAKAWLAYVLLVRNCPQRPWKLPTVPA